MPATPLTMVVLAAGMGSRFGGPKQLVPVGPAGESILDYNTHDAVAAGFERVVVVTRPKLEEQVAALVAAGPGRRAEVHVVLQRVPDGRTKPWGTADAVATAAAHVDGPFGVANADDLYGPGSFAVLAGHLRSRPDEAAAVGFPLDETVPARGSVSRGILQVAGDGRMAAIAETHGIHRVEGGLEPAGLALDDLGSMNLWGLPLAAMAGLQQAVAAFVATGGAGEVFLPTEIGVLSASGLPVRVLRSDERWSGMTNPEDVDGVRAHAAARWPSPLWVPEAAHRTPVPWGPVAARPHVALARALPPGIGTIGAGVAASGVGAYGFLLVAARTLGPAAYAPLAVLWNLLFLGTVGCFIPLEQELARSIAHRRARGDGIAPLVRSGAAVAAVVAGALALTLLALGGPVVDDLFDGRVALLVALVAALVAYGGVHVTRSVLAGSRAHRRFATLLVAEGLGRLAVAAAFLAAGVTSLWAWGALLAATPVALLVGFGRAATADRSPGSAAPVAGLARSYGSLLAAALLAQAVFGTPAVAVKALAGAGEAAAVGRFQAGLAIARVPIFLFAAIEVTFLPRLAELAAAGRHDEVRSALERLVALVVLVSAAGALASAVVGPPLLRVAVGPAFAQAGGDLAVLTAAGGGCLVALVVGQALIALSGHSRVAVGWAAGVVAGAAALAVGRGVGAVERVEVAYLVAAVTAAVAMALLVAPLLRRTADHELVPVPTTVADRP